MVRKGDGTGLAATGYSQVRKGDGTVLWNAIPDAVVEDWERTDPLTDYAGDTSKFGTTTTSPVEGDVSLTTTADGEYIIYRSSGVEAVPSKGDVFSSVLRDPGARVPAFCYGWSESSGNFSGYEVFLAESLDEIRLRRYDSEAYSNNGTDILTLTQTIAADTAYEVEVEWHDGTGSQSDGTHVVTVYDYDTTAADETEARGTELVSDSVSDTTYTSGGIAQATESGSTSTGIIHDRYWILGSV